MIMWFLSFLLFICCITFIHPWNETSSVMDYDLCDRLLNLICHILLRIFASESIKVIAL
jgi:hypothetical protein